RSSPVPGRGATYSSAPMSGADSQTLGLPSKSETEVTPGTAGSPALRHGDAAVRCRSPFEGSANSGSASMFPMPGHPPSTSDHVAVALVGSDGIGPFPQKMQFTAFTCDPAPASACADSMRFAAKVQLRSDSAPWTIVVPPQGKQVDRVQPFR